MRTDLRNLLAYFSGGSPCSHHDVNLAARAALLSTSYGCSTKMTRHVGSAEPIILVPSTPGDTTSPSTMMAM